MTDLETKIAELETELAKDPPPRIYALDGTSKPVDRKLMLKVLADLKALAETNAG